MKKIRTVKYRGMEINTPRDMQTMVRHGFLPRGRLIDTKRPVAISTKKPKTNGKSLVSGL